MKEEKYGIILYKDSVNLGDDIQTYAAYKLLPKVDYIIDREKISYFVPETKEKVKVIMNGWFNYDKTQFLISPYIDPLFVSLHLTAIGNICEGYDFLDNYAKKILSNYRIGCRDKHTLEQLKSMGYKNIYFSGCLTTTIKPIKNLEKPKKDYIVVVDMKPEIVEHLKKITNLKVVETTHWNIFHNKKSSYKEKQKLIDKFNNGSEEVKKEMVKEHAKLSLEERMKIAEKQLELYQNAKLVITDRIHVGLPCLGLNTPCLLIYYEKNKDRVETFKDYLKNCTEEEFMQMESKDLIKIKNSKAFIKKRDNLLQSVKDFIEKETESCDALPSTDSFKSLNIEREEYIKNLYYGALKQLNEKNEVVSEENKNLREENIVLREEKELFDKIRSSRSWKLIGKYYEIRAKIKGG